MIVKTPGPDGTIIEKTVQTGGAIIIQVPGTVYQATCAVVNVDESDQSVEVKTEDFAGWVLLADIKDVQSPSEYALDNAINVIGK